MLKNRFVLLLFFFFPVFLFGQTEEELKGDFHFDHQEFYKSIELYEKAQIKDANNLDLLYKLSLSYYSINNYSSAYKGFKTLIDLGYKKTDIDYNFAVLAENHEDYDLAEKHIKIHLKENPSDAKGINLAQSLKEVRTQMTISAHVNISPSSTNTKENDIGAFYYNNKFIFLTGGFNKTSKIHDWDNQHFLSFYELDHTLENSYQKKFPALKHDLHNGPGIYSNQFNQLFYTRNEKLQKHIGKHERISRLHIYTYDPKKKKSKPLPLSLNQKDYSIAHPAIAKNSKRLFFSSDMPNGYGKSDLYYSDYSENTGWSAPVNLGPIINTDLKENFPFVLNDSTIFFSSNGHGGRGGLDIFKAIIHENGETELINLGLPFNSSRDDFGIIFNPSDQSEGYFSSNRKNGKGYDDLYFFEYQTAQVWVKITSAKTGKVLDFSEVNLKNELNKYKTTTKKEFNKIEISKYDLKNGVDFSVSHHYYHPINFSCPLLSNNDTIEIKLTDKDLTPITGFVYDEDSKEPLSDVKVLVDDLDDASADRSGKIGQYSVFSEDGKAKKLKIKKPGYLTKEVILPSLNHSKNIKNIELEPLKKGMLIKLDKIHYEFDQYHLTPDSKIILNELVELMNDNQNMEIEITSHTDLRGSDKYNQDLASKRANSVIAYLTSQGIGIYRFSNRVYGEAKPIHNCDDCSEDEHYQNRRSEFKITKL